jgi:hypothetical protein
VKVHGSLSSNDGDVVLGWALDGHGILLRSEWDAAKYLDSGRLQVILPDYTLPRPTCTPTTRAASNSQPGCALSLIFWLRGYRQPLRHTQANSGIMKSQSSGAPVAVNVQTIHVVNRSRATPSSGQSAVADRAAAARTTPAPRCPAGRRTECGTA